jgi:hypothetical protein
LNDPLVGSDTTWERKDKVGLVVLYMDYLRSHVTQPNINNCMVALSDHLRMNMTEESIVHNWVVQGAKKSLTRKTGRDLSLTKEKRFRLPTPFVFIKHILTTYMSNQLDWDNCDSYMTGLASMISYEFGLRVSECCYHPDPDENHAVMSQDVTFEIFPGNGKNRKTQFVMPWELHPTHYAKKHLLVSKGIKTDEEARRVIETTIETDYEIQPSRVKQIHFKLRSQKNHQDGSTRRMVLTRDTTRGHALINTLIDAVISFTKFSRIGPDDPFFSRWKLNRKVLHRRMISTMLKETAVCLGYPEENFSSHCNRIGCASKLFEAGYTAEQISSIIGWTSNAVFGYLQTTPPSLFSLEERQNEPTKENRDVKLTNKEVE